MSANTERIVVARGVPAWHNENSTVLPDGAMDWETICRHVPQMAMMVTPRQLMYWGEDGKPHLVPDMVANVRADGQYVGTVGVDYQAVQGQEGFDILKELLRQGEVIADTAGTLDQGRKMFIACRAPREFFIGNDAHERHLGFMTLLNSFDTRTKIGLVLSMVRTVCENTFNANLNNHEAAYWFVHTTSVMDRIEEARRALSVSGRYWSEYERKANEMARAKFSANDFTQLVNTLVQDPAVLEKADKKAAARNAAREREELQVLWVTPDGNFEGTAYKAMQAIVAWNDHMHRGRKSERSSVAENRTRRILLDASLKQDAYNLICQMAEIR